VTDALLSFSTHVLLKLPVTSKVFGVTICNAVQVK
jgi:hypothetical protein